MDVVAASYTPVDGGMRSLPGELGSPPGAPPGVPPGLLPLVAGERQAVAAAVGGRGEELASLLVLSSCRRGVPNGVPCLGVSSYCLCGIFNFHLSIFNFFYCHMYLD